MDDLAVVRLGHGVADLHHRQQQLARRDELFDNRATKISSGHVLHYEIMPIAVLSMRLQDSNNRAVFQSGHDSSGECKPRNVQRILGEIAMENLERYLRAAL